MKESWKEEITAHEQKVGREVKKGDFAKVFGMAYLKAFTEDTIRAAFRVTGVFPFNPDVITKKQMAPSLTTSTLATFPLPQSSPVQRVMAVFHYQPQVDIPTPSNTGTQTPNIGGPSSVSEPSTNLRSILASSLSGSFLVDAVRLTSSQPITPPVLEGTSTLLKPDWSLLEATGGNTKEEVQAHIDKLTESLRIAKIEDEAKSSIIAGAQAQLVIQNLHLGKLNEVLLTKEKAKEDDRTKLFPEGKGRHLTGDDFHEERIKADAEKKAKETAKATRKVNAATRKTRNEAVAKLWKERSDAHTATVEVWKAECAELRTKGVKVRDLPKKPVRPRKVDVEEEVDGENDGVGDEDEDDGSSDGDGDAIEFDG